MTRQAVVISVIVTSLVVYGCRKSEEERYEAQPPVEPATERTPSTTAAVPPVLQQAEELTEDIQDTINAGNWSGALKMLTRLQTSSTQLRTTHGKAHEVAMFDSALSSLAQGVKSRNRLAADTSANRAAFAAVTMMASYHPRVPVAVGFMDVSARDAMYKAELNDWKGVDHATSELDKHYGSVSGHVRSRNPSLDTSLKSQMEALKRAAKSKNMNQVKTASMAILEQVDRIEQTY